MMNPINYGAEYFKEAEQFFSKACMDLYLSSDQERTRVEIAQRLQRWREQWQTSEKFQFCPLITAVEMMLAHQYERGR